MRIALKQTIFPKSLHNKHTREFSENLRNFLRSYFRKTRHRCI